MGEYSEEILQVFLENQGQLFDEPVAETLEEAEEFLDEVMAQVFPSLKDARRYLSEMGMDVDGMSKEEFLEQAEVFPIPDGTFLIVEG